MAHNYGWHNLFSHLLFSSYVIALNSFLKAIVLNIIGKSVTSLANEKNCCQFQRKNRNKSKALWCTRNCRPPHKSEGLMTTYSIVKASYHLLKPVPFFMAFSIFLNS